MQERSELVRLARSGNHQAFASLVKPLWQRLYRTAYAYVGNEADSLDMVQGALEKAFSKLDQLQDPEKFAPWLTRILINQCCNKLERKKREVPLPASLYAPQQDWDARLDIQAALAKLRPQHKEVVVLRYIHGYSLEEIADILDCPAGTIKSRHFYALRYLRETLEGRKHNEMC